jgi:AraC family transcriptional regulator, positive regulator of tynA and feaB
MQFAIYDLLGALFALSDLTPNSSHTDKLFTRVCRIARNHFSDPDLSLRDVDSEAGISLRCLQRLHGAWNNVQPVHSVASLGSRGASSE